MNSYFYQYGCIPEYQKTDELLDLMERSIDLFNDKDKFLMENEYYEVSMVHCLAQHMTELMKNDYRFHDMYVDIEYNKGADGNDHAGKYLVDFDGTRNDNIRLDLVVTGREYDDRIGYRNLICAEFKKTSNNTNHEDDKRRLQLLTQLDVHGTQNPLYGYFIGCFILIDNEKMWIENAYDNKGELPKLNGKIYIPEERYL